MFDRIVRAAKLDAALYEEVEADPSLTKEAALVVVLASLAAGIAGFGNAGVVGLFAITIGNIIGWLIWSGVIFLIGTKLLPEPQTEADFGQLLRTLGFAAAPRIAAILALIRPLAAIVALVVTAWGIAAMIVAIRQALDYESTGRAAAVCLIGFVAQFLVLAPILGALRSGF